MSKIKICGLRRNEDIDYVNELLPDFIGFILTSGFRRSIDDETARCLKARLRGDIPAIGVFVNDDINRINSLVSRGIIDIVQLHGNESAEFCEKINAPVIKYIKCDENAAEKIKQYENSADYFLFDSGTGTGIPFDWSRIPKTDKPFFLAGGIGADNLKQAANTVKPFAIDLSSSVETNGVKDYNKIKQILEIARYE